ncbi:unnamed protein product [Euphydryas editha]|uniref:Vulcan n=1 Tax=Euphydryas editha TaxID=104508 RepID=A0AAU9TVP2_EUPED|nr:unnamed protein product [Euphydryas editha]
MAPPKEGIPLPTSAVEVKDLQSLEKVTATLATAITSAIYEGKTISAKNKRFIAEAAEEIRRATAKYAELAACDHPAEIKRSVALPTPKPSRESQEGVSYASITKLPGNFIEVSRQTHTGAPATEITKVQPLTTRPALIISTKTPAKSRQETLGAFKKTIFFRNTNYAPARVVAVSNNKLRIEFDCEKERDDALKRIQSIDNALVSVEMAHRLKPMVILKGSS